MTFSALKNFLKGMETEEAMDIAEPDRPLKNFLKGMETMRNKCVSDEPLCLKNFLKGMETVRPQQLLGRGREPQKLP